MRRRNRTSSSSTKRQLLLSIKNHRLSRLIHGTRTIGYGRRTRDRYIKRRRRRRRRRHRWEEEIFSGSGFNYYGELDPSADGWDEGRVRRLLERNIPEEELSLPNEPPPRLDARYLSRRFGCLPPGLYRNVSNQGITRRAPRIESYFINQYGSVPPRVRRLLTGSYHGSFFQAHPFAHRVKGENDPLDDREYRRHRRLNHGHNRPRRRPPPPPPPRPPQQRPIAPAPPAPAPPAPAPAPAPPATPPPPPSNTSSSLFTFGHFSPLSATSSTVNLDTLLDTLLEDGELPEIPTTPPAMHSPPFQIMALNSNDPPPATPVEAEQQTKISSAEKSAEDLETILSVAGSSIRSIIDKLQSPVTAASTPNMSQQQQHPDDRWNELREMVNNIPTEDLYDELLDHNTSPLLPARKPQRPTAPCKSPYIAHKQMPASLSSSVSSSSSLPTPSPRRQITGYVAHKKMSTPSPTKQQSIGTSPIPQPRMLHYGTQMSPQHRRRKEHGTQMDHDIRTHNKIRSIFEDFCKGKTNTRHTTHRIMDIAHQVAKDNIR